MCKNNLFLCLLLTINTFMECCSLSFVSTNLQDLALQVNLPQGIIQGRLSHTKNQKLHYYAFTGIPYALAPIGTLRFRTPVPSKNWQGVLDASKKNITACIQITPTFLSGFPESEDCLYVNIFTPVQSLNNIDNSSRLPVMVWFYGGGFLIGATDFSYFGPDFLLEHGVIVVQVAYRLGAFGFLSTEDSEAPGNYGLKDQHLALRWIKENIQYFGGDSNRITLFGESAGAVSVQYQLLYEKNEGLFQGAISESGSVLNAWSFQRFPRKVAFDIGENIGVKTLSSKHLLNYLRTVPVEALKNAAFKVSIGNSMGILHGIPFAPTIEPNHPEAFITEKPHELLTQGRFLKVPYIIGFNSGEISIITPALRWVGPLLQIYSVDPKLLVPYGVKLTAGYEIKKRYFGNYGVSTDNYMDYINDAYFFRPITESARLCGQETPTYLYMFNYEGYLGRNALGYRKMEEYRGVAHTEEMAYIWCREELMQPSSLDIIMRFRMVKMWTNFAKNGNPTPEPDELLQNITWTPVSQNMSYLNINRKLKVQSDIFNESMKFWAELYNRYGDPPYDTY